METGDYNKLIEFLGKKFESMDEQFEEMRKTFATKDDLKDTAHQNVILHEDTKHKLDLVIEALQMHAGKNDRDMDVIREVVVRLEKNDIIQQADIDKLFKRVSVLEEKV